MQQVGHLSRGGTVCDEATIRVEVFAETVFAEAVFSKAALEAYHKQYAQKIQSKGMKRFGNKMLAFRTELEFIDEFKVSNNGC